MRFSLYIEFEDYMFISYLSWVKLTAKIMSVAAMACGSSYLFLLADRKTMAKLLYPDEDNPSAGFRF